MAGRGAGGAVAVTAVTLAAATYARHALHDGERAWPETNCYTDLWIEMLHGLGYDPMPLLAFTLAMDWEGDQYTFFKVQHEELRAVHGIAVEELNVWKPLAEHAAEQAALGRILVPEVDAWFLPDTAGVSYRLAHAKTSIGVRYLDVEARRLGYFHNAGYWELEGDDFDGVFRRGAWAPAPGTLAPYTEIVKPGAGPRLPDDSLAGAARGLLDRWLARRPAVNPIARHRAGFAADLARLRAGDPNGFHDYAFATFRQLGACFELAASFLAWLGARGERAAAEAAPHCQAIATTAKAMQFKLARAVSLRRDVDFDTPFAELVAAWDAAMARLDARG